MTFCCGHEISYGLAKGEGVWDTDFISLFKPSVQRGPVTDPNKSSLPQCITPASTPATTVPGLGGLWPGLAAAFHCSGRAPPLALGSTVISVKEVRLSLSAVMEKPKRTS